MYNDYCFLLYILPDYKFVSVYIYDIDIFLLLNDVYSVIFIIYIHTQIYASIYYKRITYYEDNFIIFLFFAYGN